MTFAFDEQFAMFDITPVENQFILEYLPGAKGEYVKVYLYGLLCCYHPKKEMDISRISQELGMTEEEIHKAFRYWERRGVVRRVQDHPAAWQYLNIKQISLAGDGDVIEPDYAEFCRKIENSLEDIRDFHGSELAACYEWKNEMQLSTEVIVMLLKHMARTRGKSFKIRDAEKMAMELCNEKAVTLEEAAEVLNRDEAVTAGIRKVLRKLGKKYNPSDANVMLYRKWTEEWHYSQEAIEDACDRTGTSDPSLALVDAILDNARQNRKGNAPAGKEAVDAAAREREELRQVLNEIGCRGAATPAQKEQYSRMKEIYPQSILMMAARECAIKQKNFDSVMKLLESWKERGFTEEEQIREHIRSFHEKEAYLQELKGKWNGKETEIGQKTLRLLEKWENEMGFSREMISLSADLAFEAKKPLSYMDRILCYWAEQGIRTPDAAQQDRKAHGDAYSEKKTKPGEKTNPAQQYTQRDYTGAQDEARKRMISMMGGQDDA